MLDTILLSILCSSFSSPKSEIKVYRTIILFVVLYVLCILREECKLTML